MNFNMILISTLLFAMCLFSTCNSQSDVFQETAFKSSEKLRGKSQGPLVLKLAVLDTYAELTAPECVKFFASRQYEELQFILKIKYQIDLQLTYYAKEADLDEAVIGQNYDGMICNPWLAFRQVPVHGMNFSRIADLLDPFDSQFLFGAFIVGKNSAIESLEDLEGKRLAIGNKKSFEKYHMPLKLLERSKLQSVKIIHNEICNETVGDLLDGKADAGVISDYSLIASCAAALAKEEDFRIIAQTDNMPLCSVILDLTKTGPAEAQRLQDALLTISREELPGGMISSGFVKPMKWRPERFTN